MTKWRAVRLGMRSLRAGIPPPASPARPTTAEVVLSLRDEPLDVWSRGWYIMSCVRQLNVNVSVSGG
ncbi:hypothetical protein E2C01_088103 [Portunus trituberculatus]|uniref:Uncharacterized protein n=1 Tax=Portunus trituberculatus TaxID=210409 RepID=A0A5B7JIZ3_PORTR|nr:hypothetical protein [Portunus trituberculatus]